MIDRIEQIINDINDYLASEKYKYEAMPLASDELRFIAKCLMQYQDILTKEMNKNE